MARRLHACNRNVKYVTDFTVANFDVTVNERMGSEIALFFSSGRCYVSLIAFQRSSFVHTLRPGSSYIRTTRRAIGDSSSLLLKFGFILTSSCMVAMHIRQRQLVRVHLVSSRMLRYICPVARILLTHPSFSFVRWMQL